MLYCPFSFSRLIFNRGLSSIKNQKKGELYARLNAVDREPLPRKDGQIAVDVLNRSFAKSENLSISHLSRSASAK